MCWAKTTKIMGIRGPVARVPKTVTYKTYPHFSMGGLGPPAPQPCRRPSLSENSLPIVFFRKFIRTVKCHISERTPRIPTVNRKLAKETVGYYWTNGTAEFRRYIKPSESVLWCTYTRKTRTFRLFISQIKNLSATTFRKMFGSKRGSKHTNRPITAKKYGSVVCIQ